MLPLTDRSGGIQQLKIDNFQSVKQQSVTKDLLFSFWTIVNSLSTLIFSLSERCPIVTISGFLLSLGDLFLLYNHLS